MENPRDGGEGGGGGEPGGLLSMGSSHRTESDMTEVTQQQKKKKGLFLSLVQLGCKCSWSAGQLCSLVPQEPRFFLKLLTDNICIIKLDGFHMKGTEKEWRRHNSVSEDPGS